MAGGPYGVAIISGVKPPKAMIPCFTGGPSGTETAFGSAPAFRSSLAISTEPSAPEFIRGVIPFRLLPFTSTWLASPRRTAVMLPA